MKGILIQQKVFKAIDGKKVDNLITAKELWDKLEELYTESSLPTIKYGRDSVNLETVISGLKSKEIDLRSSKPIQNQPEVNLVRGRTKNRNHEYKHRRHSNSKSRSRGRSNSRPKYNRDRYEKKDVRCYNCGGRGHFIKDCKKPRRNPPKDSANNSDDTVDEVYMLSDVNAVKSVLNKHEWLIDSGCTVHMTPYRDILFNYKSDNLGSVSMANEKRCDVLGVGDVCMIFENGFKFTLKNVKHVPDLAYNLMSCSALEEEGLEGRWGKGIMKIMKGSLNVFKAERKKNLYICSVTYDIIAASVTHMNTSDLWHKRLGHISSKGLELLHKHGVLNDKINDLSFCDDCILVLYVDDMLIVSSSMTLIRELQNNLSKNFKMKDLGDAKKILGMSIERNGKSSTIFLNQKSYVKNVVKKFSMSNAKSTSVPLAAHFQLCKNQSPNSETEKEPMKNIPYSNAIGSVLYLMISTRPDIAYVVSCLSRFMSNAGIPHWEALKWLLRYLNSSVDIGIIFSKLSDDVKLVGYVDSNYANDRDSRRSTTSYMFTLCGACISWKSQLQNIVALSTTEAEYIATTEALKEAIWLKGLLDEIGFLKHKITVFSDSQSSIQLCKNPVFHDRTKHIDVKALRAPELEGNDEANDVPTPWIWSKVEIVSFIWPKSHRPNSKEDRLFTSSPNSSPRPTALNVTHNPNPYPSAYHPYINPNPNQTSQISPPIHYAILSLSSLIFSPSSGTCLILRSPSLPSTMEAHYLNPTFTITKDTRSLPWWSVVKSLCGERLCGSVKRSCNLELSSAFGFVLGKSKLGYLSRPMLES
ncbi:UNVERIFIED_CONTAM: Retrovirus-related Pol polyprotein from transposon TNT 1-94 [Sesamum latifolium]|uniref:Retrovirus-related Pol polyprotein from transposon TNT 1-94 n=1 Tax=Sesamum latifolium TaxID=2727402 RepID=A0AAW2XG48_9LAMI